MATRAAAYMVVFDVSWLQFRKVPSYIQKTQETRKMMRDTNDKIESLKKRCEALSPSNWGEWSITHTHTHTAGWKCVSNNIIPAVPRTTHLDHPSSMYIIHSHNTQRDMAVNVFDLYAAAAAAVVHVLRNRLLHVQWSNTTQRMRELVLRVGRSIVVGALCGMGCTFLPVSPTALFAPSTLTIIDNDIKALADIAHTRLNSICSGTVSGNLFTESGRTNIWDGATGEWLKKSDGAPLPESASFYGVSCPQ